MWTIMRDPRSGLTWVLFNVRVEGDMAHCVTMFRMLPNRSTRDMEDMADESGVHSWAHRSYDLEII